MLFTRKIHTRLLKHIFGSAFFVGLILYSLPIFELSLNLDVPIVGASVVSAKSICVNGSATGVAPDASGSCPDGKSPRIVPDNFGSCNSGSTLDWYGVDAAHCYKADGTVDGSRLTGSNYKRSGALGFNDPEFYTTGYFLIYITSGLVALAGKLLNASITHFILNMGTYLSATDGVGKGLNAAWTVIRDIVNLTFVFGLIYLAFMTIAQADTHKLKHGVVNIIKGALLVNFSMFFAKMIIDIANVTAITIFANMNLVAGTPGQQENFGIAWFFFEKLGLLTLMDPIAAAQNVAGSSGIVFDTTSLSWTFSIMVSLVFLITSFVMIAGAVLIAIRFIVLTLIIVLSPIAFASGALPKLNTEELSHDWWGRLINHSIFAPAYFLMLWVSMQVIDIAALKQASLADFLSKATPLAMVNFIMVIGFMIGSLIIAKKFGAYGAEGALGFGKSLARGTGSFAGRWGIGAPSSYMLKKYEGARARDSQSRGGRFLNSTLYNLGIHGAVHGALAKGKSSTFGGGYSWESAGKAQSSYEQHNAAHAREHEREHAVEAGLKVMKELNASGAVPSNEQSAAIKALAGSLKDMSDNERAGLKVKVLSNENIAMHLSDKHIEALEKHEDVSTEDIAQIKDARKRAFANIAAGGGAGHITGTRDADWLGNRSTKDVAALPVGVLSHADVVKHLSPEVVKQKLEDGMSAADQSTLHTAIQSRINDIRTRTTTGTASNPEKAYVKAFEQWTDKTTHGAKFGLV
jgi:hypothetical protein